MTILTSTAGQKDLPRYFASAFSTAQKLRHGRLDIRLDDGRVFRIDAPGPGPVAELAIHHPDLCARLIREGDLGFSEAYLEGWWTTPDLQAFLDLLFADNDAVFDSFLGMGLVRAIERLRNVMLNNTRRQAKKNIAYHYDLGNDFYARWLDETMTYSSALFETGQESLERAQTQKYAAIVDAMGVAPGDHVLEIGCGWGGFAEYAARDRGLRVTGITISRAQHDYAVERIARAGLADRVEIVLRDYREERGRYDGIASIEMFEAVGQKYWPDYFTAVRERLNPGRRATVQIITVADHRWDVYRKGVDFIQKYIFPGGMLPSPRVLREQIARAGLDFTGSIEFGESYSQTLRRWHERFDAEWEAILEMGFDIRFRRMWDYYLTSCAAAFRGGACDVTQVTMARPA